MPLTDNTASTVLALVGASPAGLLAHLASLRTHSPAAPLNHLVLLVRPADAPAWLNALATVHRPSAWPADLPAGFHRLQWRHWTLTLCIGSHADTIAALHCQATRLWVDADVYPADSAQTAMRLARTLARHCAHGATLWLADQPTAPSGAAGGMDHQGHLAIGASDWAQAGFVAAPARDARDAHDTTHADSDHTNTPHCGWQARYLPRWPVAAPVPAPPAEQRHALVIGAGLAGAAVCASLTRRGWRVDLLDRHAYPAGGASALPVGMLSEHATAQPTVLSILSRAGMAMHLRELAASVPQGQGWQTTWVSNLRADEDGSEVGGTVDEAAAASPPDFAAVPRLPAAMVRPAALVQAWLAQAQATGLLATHWQCPVARLEQVELNQTGADSTAARVHWQALDADGRVLASAPHVVVTAAYDSAALLAPHMTGMTLAEPLRAVKGQMTFAPLHGQPLAPHTLRDHGVYVPCYEDSLHPTAPRLWTMGSTYERGQNNREITLAAQQRNAASLQAMLPQAHARLQQQAQAGELLNWAEVRCASLDRLPMVGGVPAPGQLKPSTALLAVPRVAGLWTFCALGSRGLTLSALGAELLVARMLGEPLPVEKKLADALDPARFALKASRKSG